MSSLRLLFLGPPRLERGGEPVALDNRKALALLAYLVVTGHSHSRDGLATLLWPDYDQRQARNNLRYSLWALKKALGEGWLAVERESVALEHSDRLWLDMAHFQSRLAACQEHSHPLDEICPACLPLLSEAVGLYRGDFLAGFSLPDSPDFDEWQFFQTEEMRRELARALEQLMRGHSAQGEYEPAIGYARRWLMLDPLHEPPHRHLMQLYARTGQPAAALRQYQECVRLLEAELGGSPEPATTELYEAIKAKRSPPSSSKEDSPSSSVMASYSIAPLLPSPNYPLLPFLAQKELAEAEQGLFVAREAELAQLNNFLDQMLTGQGQVAVVTGEAGSGKTALLHQFARHAQVRDADLIIASGYCNAQTGLGDPYLPFRQILNLLTGDLDAGWVSGMISSENAARLWARLPVTLQVLVEFGPDLINSFLPGAALLSRVTSYIPTQVSWLSRLEQLATHPVANATDLGQRDLFEQYSRLLQHLAGQQPHPPAGRLPA